MATLQPGMQLGGLHALLTTINGMRMSGVRGQQRPMIPWQQSIHGMLLAAACSQCPDCACRLPISPAGPEKLAKESCYAQDMHGDMGMYSAASRLIKHQSHGEQSIKNLAA